MGRLIKILLLIVAGIVGVVVLASVALYLFFDPNDFRDDISAQVQEATGRELVIEGDLSISLFPWIAVNVGRTRLGNAPGFGDEPFLQFEEARLSVKLLPLLLERQITVGTASLDGLALNLAVAANGRNNWDDLAKAEEAPADEAEVAAEQALDIADVRLSNASIAYRDAQAKSSTNITGLGLRTGTIRPGEPFAVDAEFDFRAEPAAVSGHLQVDGDLTLAKNLEQVSVRGLDIAGALDGVAAGTTDFRFAAPAIEVDLSSERVTLGKMELALLGLKIDGDVEAFSYAKPEPKMTLDVAPFSVRALMQALGTEPPVTADPKALSQAKLNAIAQVGETSIALKPVTLKLDDTQLKGSLSLPLTETGAYRFDLTADRIDLDRYMAPADAGGGTGAAAEDDIEIPIDLIQTLNAKGTLKIERANLSGMTFENVVVGVEGGKGQLRLHPITATLFEGSYSGDVRINAAGKTPSISVNENVIGVQLKPLARAMFQKEQITGTIEGSFKLSGNGATLAAIRRDLDGSMAFTLADGAWEGTDIWHQLRTARALFKREAPPAARKPPRTEFSAVRITGQVTDGVFRSDDLLAELPFLRLTGAGQVDMAEGQVNYAMQARVLDRPEFQTPASEAELADFTEAVIPLKVTGPLASPSVKPDVEGMLKAEVKRTVEKKGEELKKRLLDRLVGGERPPAQPEPATPGAPGAQDEPPAEGEQQAPPEEEPKPEDELKDALKKLFDR